LSFASSIFFGRSAAIASSVGASWRSDCLNESESFPLARSAISGIGVGSSAKARSSVGFSMSPMRAAAASQYGRVMFTNTVLRGSPSCGCGADWPGGFVRHAVISPRLASSMPS